MKKVIAMMIVAGAASLMAADGTALYAKCAACHGAKAEKKALNKSDVIAGWPVEQIVASLKGYKAGTENKHGMGAVMKGQVATYSDADIEAVAKHISAFK